MAVNYYIQHKFLKFILLLTLIIAAYGCDDSSANHLKEMKSAIIQIDSKYQLKTYLAITDDEQIQGLSGVKPQDFSKNEAMLFTADKDKPRQFWMPNTFFDLDIFFLSEDLYVLDVHRSLSHFEKDGPDHKVPRSKTVRCTHVLEVRSDSELAQKIHPGMILKWQGKDPL